MLVEIERAVHLRERLVVTTSVEQRPPDVPAGLNRKWIELLRFSLLDDGALELAGGGEKVAVLAARRRVGWIEGDGAAELALAGLEVPVVPDQHHGQRRVRLRERVVDGQRAPRRF